MNVLFRLICEAMHGGRGGYHDFFFLYLYVVCPRKVFGLCFWRILHYKTPRFHKQNPCTQLLQPA